LFFFTPGHSKAVSKTNTLTGILKDLKINKLVLRDRKRSITVAKSSAHQAAIEKSQKIMKQP